MSFYIHNSFWTKVGSIHNLAIYLNHQIWFLLTWQFAKSQIYPQRIKICFYWAIFKDSAMYFKGNFKRKDMFLTIASWDLDVKDSLYLHYPKFKLIFLPKLPFFWMNIPYLGE